MAKAKTPPSGPAQQVHDLAKELFALKARKASLEDELTQVEKDIKEIAAHKLPRLMEDAEIDKQSIKGLGTVYLGRDFFASVLKEDRPKLYAWMRENGHGDLVQSYVFPMTLTAFCKEQLEKGQAIPECVQATFLPVAKTRRA